MDLRNFQDAAEELIRSAKITREKSRKDSGVERLISLEEKLARMIDSGLSRLPSEPVIIESLRQELKKTRQLRNSLLEHVH